MPRPLRFHVPNGIWHVMQLATDDEVFFRVPADFQAFMHLFAVTARWACWIVHEYCLMTTHVHMLVQTPLPTLPAGMQRLMGTYVEEFNARHGRRGALVHGRYKAKFVDSEEYYDECLRYIVDNPLGAGLCERPEEWPWCSFAQRADPSVAAVWGPGPDLAA